MSESPQAADADNDEGLDVTMVPEMELIRNSGTDRDAYRFDVRAADGTVQPEAHESDAD